MELTGKSNLHFKKRLYRPNVGILLLNTYNLIWVGERIDLPGAWQMPQGGIDPNETISDAFFRETNEEIGIPREKAEIIAVSRQILRYDFPPHVLKRQPDSPYCGQEQHWVIARFLGRDQDISTDTEDPEFGNWRWVTSEQLLKMVVRFKRNTYIKIFEEFSDIIEHS